MRLDVTTCACIATHPGTQCVDSNSGHLKTAALSVNARHREAVDAHLRVFQWNHWIRSADRWAEWEKVLVYCNETMHQ